MILGVNAGIDETSLQVTQFLFNKSLLSRGEKARVYVTQAKGGLNRDPALAINQVRPGILDRFDDIRLDSHHPTGRSLFRRNRPDHGGARRPNVGGKVRYGNIRIAVNGADFVLEDKDIRSEENTSD